MADLADTQASKGFLAGLLGDVPGFVRGILATMFGTTICLVAMLQLGGLQVPVTNWLTSQMQRPVADLNKSIAALQLIVARIETLEALQRVQNVRIDAVEQLGIRHTAEQAALAAAVDGVDKRVRKIELDHKPK